MALQREQSAQKSQDAATIEGVLAHTLGRAARISGLSIATLRRHEKAGRLTFYRVGRRTLVSAASLRALLGVEA